MGNMPTDTNLFCDRALFKQFPGWPDATPGEALDPSEEAEPPAPSTAPAPSGATRSAAGGGDDLLGVDLLLLHDDPTAPRTIEDEERALQQRHAAEEEAAREDGEEESDDGTSMSMSVSTPLESILVRRRPPSMSPRSWSNFDKETTPEKDIFRLIASRLAPPPSMSKDPMAKENVFYQAVVEIQQALTERRDIPPASAAFQSVWRWVLVDDLYHLLSREQRQRLPFYKGLVNFLRLHGTVFELSNDFRYVIAHDPSGVPAPYTPTQRDFSFEERAILPGDFDTDPSATATLIGEEDRTRHREAIGNSQIPTSRKQLAVLDPHNPLLLSSVLHEEVAKLVPPRGHMLKSHLLGSLPPIMRAAFPVSYNFAANVDLQVFRDHGVECVRRASALAGPPTTPREEPTLSLEEAVEVLRESIPEHGATPRALVRMYLPNEVVETFRAKMGSILTAARAYPQYFEIEENSSALGEFVIRLKESGR
ncbi:hypothetical protein STCU_12199 [Strigomonas culicis]|uniref:Uncharacterized protein n=1 Tax=Strigomonas culicis TaxID=28005 RepID=S9UXI5_9TRYP|nr:hypothetical protein STCU_12199 [Strigomonas culicis]|eukprot:EPY15250.1 hypothetical protein STCU_12199 [Strigomonas culicis]